VQIFLPKIRRFIACGTESDAGILAGALPANRPWVVEPLRRALNSRGSHTITIIEHGHISRRAVSDHCNSLAP